MKDGPTHIGRDGTLVCHPLRMLQIQVRIQGKKAGRQGVGITKQIVIPAKSNKVQMLL